MSIFFLSFFSGREGVFAKQWINQFGKLSYSPIYKPLESEDILNHIEGKLTLGTYLLRKDNTVKFAVLDIDISKKLLLQESEQSSKIDLWQLVLSDATRIVKFLKNLDIDAYMENSGWKGIHIWIFFETPVKADEVKKFLKNVLRKIDPAPQGINREIFPVQEAVRVEALGSLIKLPLGIHLLTGKRCLFIDHEGNPVDNQIAYLWSIQPISLDIFKKAQTLLAKDNVLIEESLNIEDMVSVKKMIEKCKVLKYLYNKSKKENELTHYERLTLLNTLGHLGEEGRKAIHVIISNCYNYSFDITEKWIGRLSRNPASCPKIREWLSNITAVIGCYCEFKLDSQIYPSPVIHAGINPKRKKTSDRSFQKPILVESRSEEQTNSNIDVLINEYIKLKQNKGEIERKISEIENKFESFFLKKGINEIEIKIGKLKRIRKEDKDQWVVEI